MLLYRAQLPTVADVLKHPAFPTAVWNLEPTESGRLPVAQGRGGPLDIAWEIHGSGPIKIVVCFLPLSLIFLGLIVITFCGVYKLTQITNCT